LARPAGIRPAQPHEFVDVGLARNAGVIDKPADPLANPCSSHCIGERVKGLAHHLSPTDKLERTAFACGRADA
jgi:hypothetical protein